MHPLGGWVFVVHVTREVGGRWMGFCGAIIRGNFPFPCTAACNHHNTILCPESCQIALNSLG